MSGRRLSIDLTDRASEAIDRVREETGMSTAEIFHEAFNQYLRNRQLEAERALPVTREWLETLGEKWHTSADVEYIFISDGGEKSVLVSCGEKCFIVWHCIGSAICYVSTRGQLLDLLSGLGVRK